MACTRGVGTDILEAFIQQALSPQFLLEKLNSKRVKLQLNYHINSLVYVLMELLIFICINSPGPLGLAGCG